VSGRPRTDRVTLAAGLLLAGVPLLAAVLGPLVAPSTPPGTAPLLPPGDGTVLGTDVLGRDVLGLALTGGTTVVALTLGALLLAHVVGTPLGLLLAATRRRRLAAGAVRVLDVALVLPPLLVLLFLAATGRRGVGWLLLAAAFVQLPALVRLVRSAVSTPRQQAAMESLTLAGEPWWRVRLLEPGLAALGPLVVDAGTRTVLVVTLLASANFLGVGLDPSTADWAVVIQQNASSLFLAPAAPVLPAALLVSLCAGANLLADRALDRRGAA
jgi:peptide/nickel transport system permease protein